jgi:hypothetical protein
MLPNESGSRKNKEELLLGLSPTTGSSAGITAMKSQTAIYAGRQRESQVLPVRSESHLRKTRALIAKTALAPNRGNSIPPIEGPIIPEMFN